MALPPDRLSCSTSPRACPTRIVVHYGCTARPRRRVRRGCVYTVPRDRLPRGARRIRGVTASARSTGRPASCPVVVLVAIGWCSICAVLVQDEFSTRAQLLLTAPQLDPALLALIVIARRAEGTR